MLNVPVHLVRAWTLWGLLVPHHTVNRLPYFTAQELHRAKSLARLTQEGITREQLCSYVAQVRSLLNEVGKGERELHYLGHALVIRDQKGFQDVLTQQRFFNFETTIEIADEPVHYTLPMLRVVNQEDVPKEHAFVDWFVEGCRLTDTEQLEEAINVFRKSLLQYPKDAECHFYLADVLYRTGRIQAAFERYHMAVELDPKYLEAWVQLGCLYAMDQHYEEAEQSLHRCLEIDPEFPDAHYHLAEILHEQQRTDDAIQHWETYLHAGVRGPWADLARQRLDEFAEFKSVICSLPS
jgi:tetratricopeptide (TPR) repeat protein